ncbi:MAG: translation elongation factor Ts [Oscillospiraceae bacterium]|jgi:elongation factor Ts|nr:translation elongation factor Ts [Oscillospiraceae bacterium]
MAFTAADVKTLRETTGVGMMDCKNALAASDGDMDKAIEWLREKGLATAQKKAGRTAAEGICAAYVDGGKAAMVEVNIETDFAAKNENFKKFANDVARLVAVEAPADVDALMALTYPGEGKSVEDVRKDRVMVIGENIQVRRFVRYDGGMTVPYIHMGGKIGVLMNLEVSAGLENSEAVAELAKDLAMQTAAMNPGFLDKSDVSEETIAKEKEILLIQAKEDPKNAGKADSIIEKMVMGRIGKFYSENCLLQQSFVKDDKVTVEKHVAEVAKAAGGSIKVKGFTRYQTGEGIEKKADNFAEEVASMVK